MVEFFNDLYKPVKDFVGKGFDVNQTKVEVSAKTGDEGLSFKPKFVRSTKDGAINMTLGFQQKKNVSPKLTYDVKVDADTNGDVKVETKFTDFAPNFKLRADCSNNTAGNSKNNSCEVGLDHKCSKAAAQLSLKKCNELVGSVVTKAGSNLQVGAEASLDVSATKLKNWNAAALWQKPGALSVYLGANKAFSSVTLGAVQKLPARNLAFGVEYNQAFGKNEGNDDFTMNAAVEHTRGKKGTCKAKVNNKGALAFAYTTHVNDLKVQAALTTNVNDLSASNFGCNFTYDV